MALEAGAASPQDFSAAVDTYGKACTPRANDPAPCYPLGRDGWAKAASCGSSTVRQQRLVARRAVSSGRRHAAPLLAAEEPVTRTIAPIPSRLLRAPRSRKPIQRFAVAVVFRSSKAGPPWFRSGVFRA